MNQEDNLCFPEVKEDCDINDHMYKYKAIIEQGIILYSIKNIYHHKVTCSNLRLLNFIS